MSPSSLLTVLLACSPKLAEKKNKIKNMWPKYFLSEVLWGQDAWQSFKN